MSSIPFPRALNKQTAQYPLLTHAPYLGLNVLKIYVSDYLSSRQCNPIEQYPGYLLSEHEIGIGYCMRLFMPNLQHLWFSPAVGLLWLGNANSQHALQLSGHALSQVHVYMDGT